MKTRAAMLTGTDRDWEVVELDVDDPGPGEVTIRWVASGLCHSDDHIRTGDILTRYPIVGGHEGAGTVLQARMIAALSLVNQTGHPLTVVLAVPLP